MSTDGITILDGGMGGELLRRSGRSGGLWSAQALLDNPELVAQIHQDYIAAGAQIIITNSYATIPSYLSKAGLQGRYEELTDLAGSIARSSAGSAVTVAGSLPPLDESYRPDLVPDDAQALPIYRRLATQLRPHVDLFICETMSCAREAVNAATAACEVGEQQPVWVSWTLSDRPGAGLRSGETVSQACRALRHLPIEGFLFNCSAPESISIALAELREVTDRPVGAYPNRFHVPAGWTLDNEVSTVSQELAIDDFLRQVDGWIATGASLIGSCCGIGPEYIRALKQHVGTAAPT